MRLLFIFGIILLFNTSNTVFAQSNDQFSNSFPEGIADSTYFRFCLDSVKHYLFFDLNRSEHFLQTCESLIKKGTDISRPLKRKYINLFIDFESNRSNYVKAYNMFNEQRDLLTGEDVPENSKQNAKLTEGYILYNLGDLESAQKLYQDLITPLEGKGDSPLTISAYYYLGQIQASQKNYKDAEHNFLKIHEIEMKDSVRNTDPLTTILELSMLYFKTEDYEKVRYYDSLGLSFAQQLKNPIFTFDFLDNMALLAIKKQQFTKAEKLIKEAKQIVYKLESVRQFETHLVTCAKFQREQKKYPEALKIYEHLLDIDSKEDPSHTIDLYKNVHDIYHKTGNNDKAYQYLLKTKTTQDSIFNEKKIQRFNFLNRKFEAEQKEKENQLLTSQVLQKQTQNKYLFALAFICLLGILGLFGAFYQKQKYNLQLKEEIKNQTKELQNTNHQLIQSNEELAQFNNILSHDLKEPVRSIVGFCTLAKKQVPTEHKINEYLQYIEKGGKQLHKLLEDVFEFNNVDKLNPNKIKPIDLNKFMVSLTDSIHSLMEQKNVEINYPTFPIIHSNQTILYLVLKNLIENGIKYNESKPAIINIAYKVEKQEHVFLIQDNGIGISKEFHTKIFGMFKRLHDRGKYSGSGLGLSIVQKTIQKINGKVTLTSSELGKGSVFEVRFPVKEVSPNVASPILEAVEK